MGILSDSTKFTTTVSSQRWLDSDTAAVLAPHGKRVAAAWQAVVTESAASEAMLRKLWAGHAARLNETPKKRAAPDDVDTGPGGQGQQAKRPAGREFEPTSGGPPGAQLHRAPVARRDPVGKAQEGLRYRCGQ